MAEDKASRISQSHTRDGLAGADQRPYFFWDYGITDREIHELLRSGSAQDKAWIITRILEYARWNDIWHYLTPADIRQHLPNLRFRRPADRDLWAYALDRWSRRG